MDRRPDDQTRRDDLDHMSRPRLTPRPDGGGGEAEPIAEVLQRADDDRPEKAAENPERPVPLTESERTPRESLSDLIPEPNAERPEGDGQVTPPIAP